MFCTFWLVALFEVLRDCEDGLCIAASLDHATADHFV